MNLLSEIVAGKAVDLIANNPAVANYAPTADIVIRCNNDPNPDADVWCTAFWGPYNDAMNLKSRLVVSSVPYVVDTSHGYEKDYTSDIDAWTPAVTPPIEIVPTSIWRQLATKCRSVPLTGVTMAYLLANCNVASCTLVGFDFYKAPHYSKLRQGNVIGYVHDAIGNISALRDLVINDGRFFEGPETTLNASLRQWRLSMWKARFKRLYTNPESVVRSLLRHAGIS